MSSGSVLWGCVNETRSIEGHLRWCRLTKGVLLVGADRRASAAGGVGQIDREDGCVENARG